MNTTPQPERRQEPRRPAPTAEEDLLFLAPDRDEPGFNPSSR